MIEEPAVVVRVEGEYAWVEADRRTSCGQCAAQKGCGTSIVANWYSKKMQAMRVINSIDAQVGDQVVVGLNEGALVKSSLIMYILPLLSMIAFVLLGQWLLARWFNSSAEGILILFALTGLGVAWGLVRIFHYRIKLDSDFQPMIVRRSIMVSPRINIPQSITKEF
jgi:sigma-E factor negative regulatory protein RseC